MKKDYTPVSASAGDLPEIQRIENHWSGLWAGRETAATGIQLDGEEIFLHMKPYLEEALSRPGGRVLDEGCGLGAWTVALTRRGIATTGIDISHDTIARLLVAFPGCDFRAGDIRHLPFPDASFRVCFSWGVFEHFEDGLQGCITEAVRVLEPGGWLFLTVPFHNWRHIIREARPLERWDGAYRAGVGYDRPMRFYQWRLTVPELQRELALGGFKVARIKPIHKTEGLERSLVLDCGLKATDWSYRLALGLCRRFMPSSWVSHMLFAAAQKPPSA